MEFFCSRCGARLEAPGELASSRVRCGSCRGVTRTPDAVEGLPVATVAEPGPVILGDGPDPPVRPIGDDEALRHLLRPDEALVGRPILDYAATAPSRRGSAATEELAERLAQIHAGDDSPSGAMVDCPHCDSRIPTYARKCPFCRHPLYGP